MYYQRALFFCFLLLTLTARAQTPPSDAELAVWANEAIVATYTYNYKNFLERQREIAKYFTANGWISYSKALNNAKLPETIKKNAYYVSAVATLPPEVKATGQNQWQAVMPLLVVYKNPQYRQKQTLLVTIDFIKAPSGQGVRRLAIESLRAKIQKSPCRCNTEEDATSESAAAKAPAP